MSLCPKCGLQRGLHNSILPGCMCYLTFPAGDNTIKQETVSIRKYAEDIILLCQALEALQWTKNAWQPGSVVGDKVESAIAAIQKRLNQKEL